MPAPARSVGGAAAAALIIVTLGGWAALIIQAWRIGGESPFLNALCSPAGATPAQGLLDFVFLWAETAVLWSVMSIAMMLPTAVPMVGSFVERADDRQRRIGTSAPSPAWLIAGYLSVWIGVSVAAGLLQSLWLQAGSAFSLPPVIAGVLAGSTVTAAGIYQFSDLKYRFLSYCRHELQPDAAELDRGGVVRLGIAQGVRCVGCCAAIMAMMLVAGAMNLFWMACFALLMTIEKLTEGSWAPRLVGVVLVLAGVVLAVSSVGFGAILKWAGS